eukprot:TRINITY_DN2795_c0_g1_i1.p1 TRINITY_DN2795_c0_g1~~TRINITY_DN2795_c0_g1_i1.p1  ORF type:complete len:138 (-),score=7.76 TRINITY_DN2795_c0_g1_i1:433-846(-)
MDSCPCSRPVSGLIWRAASIQKLLVLIFVSGLSVNDASVRMPSFFSDNMALQADHGTGTPSFINGFATSLEPIEVVVSYGTDRTFSTQIVADAAGHFVVQLDPVPARTTGWISVTGKDGKTVRANNVIWGDIFFCSG